LIHAIGERGERLSTESILAISRKTRDVIADPETIPLGGLPKGSVRTEDVVLHHRGSGAFSVLKVEHETEHVTVEPIEALNESLRHYRLTVRCTKPGDQTVIVSFFIKTPLSTEIVRVRVHYHGLPAGPP
jgi:hypothetical protein